MRDYESNIFGVDRFIKKHRYELMDSLQAILVLLLFLILVLALTWD